MSVIPVFEADYSVRLNEIGPDAKMRMQPVLDVMQDMAARHAELLGLGMPQLKALGIAWVLSRMKVRFNRFVEQDDRLHVTTWPSGVERLFCTRQFEVRSIKQGDVAAVGSSCWLMLNGETLRPVAPAAILEKIILPDNKDRAVYFPGLGKLPAVNGTDPLEMRVGQFQIDYNDHMNNSYYAVQAQEWLARKTGRPVRITEFQINFNHACKFGDVLATAGTCDGKDFAVEGLTADGKNVFQVVGTYQ